MTWPAGLQKLVQAWHLWRVFHGFLVVFGWFFVCPSESPPLLVEGIRFQIPTRTKQKHQKKHKSCDIEVSMHRPKAVLPWLQHRLFAWKTVAIAIQVPDGLDPGIQEGDRDIF